MSTDSVFQSPQALAEQLRMGNMIVLLDDENRENEGDLILAAQWVTPEAINFMATHGRGLICLALSAQRCQQLQLPMMVNDNQSLTGTNFTISIEARHGVTTGISAHDRATTIKAAIAKEAKPSDIVQPGHIFPLRAQEGGVLIRAGHTEAACDLTRLAGFEPAAVIVEILNPDGSMARRAQLEQFAREHNLAIGSIADLIKYRLHTERNVERTQSMRCFKPWDEFELIGYTDTVNKRTHLACVKGDVSKSLPLVRVHQARGIADALSVKNTLFTGWTLYDSLKTISTAQCGALILLNFAQQLDSRLEDVLFPQKENSLRCASETHSRDYVGHGIGAQILRDLGISRMRLLSSSAITFRSLSGFGLEVAEYIAPPNS